LQYAGSPKFKVLKYDHTQQSFSCLAILFAVFTDDNCDPAYYYTTTGTERDIATKVNSELRQKGYSELNLAKHVHCGDATEPSDDLYTFEKPVRGFARPQLMYLSFYRTVGPWTKSPEEHKVGCSNVYGTYTVDVLTVHAQ
jgi:hypothetical protein